MRLTILSGANELADKFRDCCRQYSRLDMAVAWCGDPTYKAVRRSWRVPWTDPCHGRNLFQPNTS